MIEEGKSATQWVGNDTLPGAFAALNPQVEIRVQGNGEPSWVAGWTNTFAYKAFSVSSTLEGQKGSLVNLGTWRHWDGQKNAVDHDEINPLTGERVGDERRRWQRLATLTHTRDASYIKLRELRVSLDLPSSMLRKVWGGISSATVSFAGRNLITNQGILGGNFFPGNDPATANYNSGTERANNVQWLREFAAYPSSRTFWLVIDLGF